MSKTDNQEETELFTSGIKIVKASIVDGMCNYTFEVSRGVGIGDQHSVKGKGVVKSDLIDAMDRLRVHLALMDEAFKGKGITFTTVEEIAENELVETYFVTGIAIKGGEGDEKISIDGHKHSVAIGGYINLKTPAVLFSKPGAYQWQQELEDVVQVIRMEVELYRNGKYTQTELEDEDVDKAQLKIFAGGDGIDADAFAKAKI